MVGRSKNGVNRIAGAWSKVAYKTVRKRVASLKPSPENLQLYRSTNDDPDIDALGESIRQHGLQEPLLITKDNYITSGHRRLAAMRCIGKVWCTVRILPVRRADISRDEFLALLREHNRQRNKTVAEQVREELLDLDPEAAYVRLCVQRQRSVNAAAHNGVSCLQIEGHKRRHGISEDKADHVKYILQIVEEPDTLPVLRLPAGNPAHPVLGAPTPGQAARAGGRDSATSTEDQAESEAQAAIARGIVSRQLHKPAVARPRAFFVVAPSSAAATASASWPLFNPATQHFGGAAASRRRSRAVSACQAVARQQYSTCSREAGPRSA